jgi:hypothetical protein
MKVLSLPTFIQPGVAVKQTIVRVVQNAVTFNRNRAVKKASSMTPAEVRSAISANGCSCGGHCAHCTHIFKDIYPQ